MTLNAFAASNAYNPTFPVVALQVVESTVPALQPPLVYAIVEGIANSTSFSNPSFVTFPQEEIALGRDITVDGLFLSLWADVSEDVTVNFYITILQNVTTTPGAPAVYESVRVLYATLILTPIQFNTLDGDPIEMQLFSTAHGAGAITGHSPQLGYEVVSLPDAGTAQLRFSKLAMFCSYDPAQRPV
jgi:hypothetical protein